MTFWLGALFDTFPSCNGIFNGTMYMTLDNCTIENIMIGIEPDKLFMHPDTRNW